MKKLILVVVTVCLMCIELSGCNIFGKKTKDTLGYLKSLKTYQCSMDITVKNDKQNLNYVANQFYSKKFGYRFDFDKERKIFYNNDKLYVSDMINGQRYVLDNDFGYIYKVSFIGEFIKLMYTNESIDNTFKTLNGEEYEIFTTDVPSNNRNISKAVLYVDVKTKLPVAAIMYDDSGKDKIIVKYKNFKPNIKLGDEIFNQG